MMAAAVMLRQPFELPSWLRPDQAQIARELAAKITTTGDDSPVFASTTESHAVIEANDYFAQPSFSSFNGSGYSIAVLDTGADLDHPDFGPDSNGDGVADRIVHHWDYHNNDSNGSDDNGHGTHVASTVARLATGANLIVLKALSATGGGSFANIERALQWVVANAGTHNIVAVNMSLGDNGNYTTNQALYGIDDELALLSGASVIPVAAAGNRFFEHGSAPGVAYPAADISAIAVGATFDANVGPQDWYGLTLGRTHVNRVNLDSMREGWQE